YRIHHWGRKWHTSAEASRLGPLAAELEKLLHRDRNTLAEAFQILRSRGESVTLAALEQLARRFPERAQRPTAIPLDDVGDALAVSPESVETAATGDDRLAACRSI